MNDESSILERVVGEKDTAAAYGPHFPPAASTPFVLGVAEVTCHQMVVADLKAGEITVGRRAVVEHFVPSPVGSRLTAVARLLHRQGQRLTFSVDVYEGNKQVAHVEHERVIVQEEAIRQRLLRPGPAKADEQQ